MAGTVFVISMLTLAASGVHGRREEPSLCRAATAWLTAKHRHGEKGIALF